MLFGAIVMTVVIPISIGCFESLDVEKNLYVVQAVIDSARIVGLPSSKAARAYAKNIQTPDPFLVQIMSAPKPVSERKLFFRKYFNSKVTSLVTGGD